MTGTENSPTADNIFEIGDKPQLLDKDTKQYFHTMAAK